MNKKRKWTVEQLFEAVKHSTSVRQVLAKIGLVEAGGNYAQIKKYLKEYNLDTSHFKGIGWNKGMSGRYLPYTPLEKILVQNSPYQSFKLKKRLFIEKLKTPKCEECGWNKMSKDGRIPLELDHINGDRHDNRLENLRILCPNCHSLQITHRGLNRRKRPGGETVYT
jgi:hypothetical protein